MAETTLVAFALAACGTITLVILGRALMDVLSRQDDQHGNTKV